MSLTHEQAHRLIQLKLDHALKAQEAAALAAHLHNCTACQAYAAELKEMERLLVPVMKKQWSLQPIPLSLPALMGSSTRSNTCTFLTMRTAAIGLVFVALFFSAWQFVISGPSLSNQIPLSVPPVPTPLAQTASSTSTELSPDTCEMMLYRVQPADTIASIAERFSVPEDQIMAVNHLVTKSLHSIRELVIPICNSTPTGTAHPATFTTTFTPLLKLNTSTPDG